LSTRIVDMIIGLTLWPYYSSLNCT